jgi:phospholipid transport system substrate-binding protein
VWRGSPSSALDCNDHAILSADPTGLPRFAAKNQSGGFMKMVELFFVALAFVLIARAHSVRIFAMLRDEDRVAQKKSHRHRAKAILIMASALTISSPYHAHAGIPSEQLRATTDKVLAILSDPGLKSPAKKPERRDQLRQVISSRFDFSEMAKRSLGPNWQRLNPEEQREFVQLFANLLEQTYTGQIEGFDGEKIVYGREKQNSDQAEVDTKIVTKKGEAFSVNYKLYATNQEWKIYDVVIEDISLVNNYRAQFNRLFTNSSQDFLRKLKEKQS